MVNGWQTLNLDGAHRRERYDEEDYYRNRPPTRKAGGNHDQKEELRKKWDKYKREMTTDLFTQCAAGVSCATI